MKKFSKLFLSCAAVAAVTAAVATSAMAAGEISAKYTPADATHETATLTIDASGYTAAQKTLLVLKPGKTLETVKVSEGDVLQIDQQDGNDTITVALPKDLADGKYTVYMGGDGQVYSTNFKVGNASSVLVGDVNQDTKINLSDATGVVQHAMKVNAITDADALIAADANDDSKINLSDATCIVKYSVKMTDGIGNVGQLK